MISEPNVAVAPLRTGAVHSVSMSGCCQFWVPFSPDRLSSTCGSSCSAPYLWASACARPVVAPRTSRNSCSPVSGVVLRVAPSRHHGRRGPAGRRRYRSDQLAARAVRRFLIRVMR
ncbi:MAG TPA: hypothetical protein VK601_24045 [Kofleriaceae bacterium]|nr:hypothetical protein [Kofleriaceae bacterium]